MLWRPRCEYSCAYYPLLSTRGCGCAWHPAFPTPSVFWGGTLLANLARNRRRECGPMFDDDSRANILSRRRPRKRAIQYSETPVLESRSGVLDPSRRMTVTGRIGKMQSMRVLPQTRSAFLTIFWHCGFGRFSFRTEIEARLRQPTVNGFGRGCCFQRVWQC